MQFSNQKEEKKMTPGSGRAEYRDTEGIYFYSVHRKVIQLKCLVLVQIHLWAKPYFVFGKHNLNLRIW